MFADHSVFVGAVSVMYICPVGGGTLSESKAPGDASAPQRVGR